MSIKIDASQLPCEEGLFLLKLAAYRQAREDHKTTIGVPAPLPEYDLLRTIVDRGQEVEIVHNVLQDEAKDMGRDALAELDALTSQVAALQKKVDAL